MVIPDDLPRSPTGRIPQWVIDEASGRTVDAGSWRSGETTTATATSVRPRRRSLVMVVAVVAFVVAVAALVGPARSWETARPSAAAVALADEATMTDTGKDLFYSNHPQLLDATHFPGHCPKGSGGCYSAATASIVVYQPTDERLHDEVITTAVHEMLHAAYASLSPADRHDVDQLLTSAVATLSPDDPTLLQIDGSVALDDHEQSRSTEQFAYIGTQVTQVDPRLDKVYARFLADRQSVVRAYTSTTTLLVTMSAQLSAQQQILAQMEAEGRTEEAATQRAVVDSLTDDLATLQSQMSPTG